MQKTLIIKEKESLSSIENKSAELCSDYQFKVRLPASINTKGALGIEVALIQMLGTWLKYNTHSKTFHSYQNPDPTDFKRICGSLYGIASLAMVDEVWDKTGEKLPKGLVLDSAKLIINALRESKFDAFSNRYLGVPYLKLNGYDREFEMPFYNGSEIIDSGPFYRLFDSLLRENICFNTISRYINLAEMIDIQELSSCIWELLKNTHDHGRVGLDGNLLHQNFRALIVQQQSINNDYWNQWCGDNPSITQLEFKKLWFGKSQKYNFIDISVIDFGEGFFELAKDKLSSSDSTEVLLKCFEQGWSRLSDPSRGSGLTKVLNCIHEYKGWFRVRSGNLLLEKTYTDTSSANIEKNDITVMDTKAAGTSVHISLPLPNFN